MSHDLPNKDHQDQHPQADTPPEDSPESDSSAETKQMGQRTRPTEPFQVSEAGGPLPELDEGPRPTAVDDIQATLLAAAQEGTETELGFEALPPPSLDEIIEPTVPPNPNEPPPQPVDEIQQALEAASQQGVSPEIDFDQLPEPAPFPQKRITRTTKPMAPPEPDPPAPAPPPKPDPPPSQADTDPIPAIAPEPKLTDTPQPTVTPEQDFEAETKPLPAPTDPPALLSDFWLILSLFVSFRVLTLFLLRPGGFIRDWSDFDTYLGIAALSDYSLYPFLDFWLEWPPLIPWLMVAIYRLSLLFPPWTDDPRLWFILLLGGIFLLFEIGNFLLLHRLTGRLTTDPRIRTRVLWLYAGLFPPVYAMLGFFDGVALFFLLLALELLLQNERFPSAIGAGVGFLVKIIPILILPVAVRRIWHQHQKNIPEAGIEASLYTVILGLTVILLLGPFLIVGPQWVLASARSMTDRSAWETVWAIIEGYYGFGLVLGERLDPAETNFAIYDSALDWWFWPSVTLVFIAIYGLIFIRPADYSQPRNLLAFGGVTVGLFLLYSKGYSPQFLVYLLPFIILLFPDGSGVTYALMLTGLNVLEQPIYFVLLPEAHWLLIFIVIARFILVTLLVLRFLAILWPDRWQTPLLKLHQRTPLVFGSLSALILLILTPLVLRAYSQSQVNDSPQGTMLGFMEAYAAHGLGNCQPGNATLPLLVSEQGVYRTLYPHLSGDFGIQLTAGAPQQSNFPPPRELLPTIGLAWVLPTGPQAQALSNASRNRGRNLATVEFEGLGDAVLYDFTPGSSSRPCAALARYSTDIELLNHRLVMSSGRIDVTLYWRAIAVQNQPLTVFTQLLNAEGQQVAGHDSVPKNGTAPVTAWPVGPVQADSHRLELPANLRPGQYQLITGLYNNSGERLRSTDPSGSSHPNRAVVLQTVQLR